MKAAAWLNLLGLARRAGKIAPGDNQVTLALQRQTAALVIIAEDAGSSVYRKYHLWAQDLRVPLVTIGSKAELGRAIGMGPHAVLAVVDENFGQRILQEMRISSGGISFDRKGQRQDQGVRTSQRTQARQSAADRPLASTESGKHQKSHEHGRAGSGENRAGHHGGKAASRTQARTQTGGSARSAAADTSAAARRGSAPAGGRPASAGKRRQQPKPRPPR